MDKSVFKFMALGLTQTAVEKICVLGADDSKAEVDRLRAVLDDLIEFWEADKHLLEGFDKAVNELITKNKIERN